MFMIMKVKLSNKDRNCQNLDSRLTYDFQAAKCRRVTSNKLSECQRIYTVSVFCAKNGRYRNVYMNLVDRGRRKVQSIMSVVFSR